MGKGKCLNRGNRMICCCSSECCVICIAIFYIIHGSSQSSSSNFLVSLGSGSKGSTTDSTRATSGVVGGVYAVALGVVLLVGVCMKSTCLLNVWTIVTLIHLIYLVAIMALIVIVAIAAYGKKDDSGSGKSTQDAASFAAILLVVLLFLFFVPVALDLYFLVCVKQYKNELLENANMGGYYYPSRAPLNYPNQGQDTGGPSAAPSQQGTSQPSKELEP